MEILVFKTNVRYKRDVRTIHEKINTHPGIIKWNMDLKDVDKILRIVSQNIKPSSIEYIVQNAGFVCEELKD